MQQLNRPNRPPLKVAPATTPPAPKFEFFQPVALKNSDRHGTIVGMEHISPIIALVDNIRPGWRYILRAETGIGKQPQDVLDADFDRLWAYEDDLEA